MKKGVSQNMPRAKMSNKGESEVVALRMEKDVAAFFRTKANEGGLSLSQFLKQTLMAGIMADSLQQIEKRFEEMASTVKEPASAHSAALPVEVWRSLFLTEALVSRIVESRNPQDFYEAQAAANLKVNTVLTAKA